MSEEQSLFVLEVLTTVVENDWETLRENNLNNDEESLLKKVEPELEKSKRCCEALVLYLY